LFFRRVDVEARYDVPPVGPVLLVPNHTNALVDPLVVMSALSREVTLTAKNVLGRNPLLRWLMGAFGVVTFHRRADVGKGAELRQNVRSLQLCRDILAGGGAVCIFPEGVSHSDPHLRSFQPGPARIALDFVRKDGNPGRLRIVPVGLLYTEKDRFRSKVWLRFGRPIDVARWLEAHPGGGPAELTAELQHRVGVLTLNYESRRESAILGWAAEIVSTGAVEPPPLGADDRGVADWFRLVGRLQAGYRRLKREEPQKVQELTSRVRAYRAELKRAQIAPEEVYLRIHLGRAVFFVVRELELAVVGAPLALFGAVNHVIPYQVVKRLARALSTDKDHWASNVVYPGLAVFPLCYALQLAAAWWFLPAFWAGVYTVALPYTGYYALLYRDRLGQSRRRAATFVRFLLHREDQERLAAEGRAIVSQVRELGARVASEPPGAGGEADTGIGPLFVLSASDLDAQFRDDIATLRDVESGLARLESEWVEARQAIQARSRGYFTPDEDDRVRRLLLAYRNYRLVLYEIVNRYLDHEQFDRPENQLRSFMIAYAAGLTLYARSLKLIQAYEHEPLIRAKLNEPDAKFGLGGGFFEEILRAYTSLNNYRLLAGCGLFWVGHRRDVRRLGLAADPDWSWLAEVIHRQRSAVRKTFWYVLRHRLRYDGRAVLRSLHRPMHRARYGLRAFVGATLGPRHTQPWYQPALRSEVLGQLVPKLQPGDVLLARSEHKITTALLPGFWCHAALYLGHLTDLERLGTQLGVKARARLEGEPAAAAPLGFVLEAISPKVTVTPLERCLCADHVVVLRPRVSDDDRRAAVEEAFRHLGKAYDFEFDFNVTTRLVCTELIYRSYHGRGSIALPLTRRLGRYTLSCDDIAGWYLDQVDAVGPDLAPFHAVALIVQDARGQARFVEPGAIVDVLRALRAGARPGALIDPASQTGIQASPGGVVPT
jgi:1-acyl-sn-glycerol-3-phosphate acyltransferase